MVSGAEPLQPEKFDAIVVGAGLAGISSAYLMAKAGLKVAVIERGDFAGAKNVMGGILYTQPTEQVFPGFYKQAPLERPIIEQSAWLLSTGSAMKVGHRSEAFAQEPCNCYTVLRARFDKWLAQQAVAAGALVVPSTLVEGVTRQDGKVVGVRTGREQGELLADVVIAADGVNSILARDAGLHQEFKESELALVVKEIVALPAEKIEDRFNLAPGQGASIELYGDSTAGMLGTGFIYTNKDSLSVGVGALISEFVRTLSTPYDLLERMKSHPMIKPLLEGGEPREYMAHLIPEGGFRAIPQLFTDGMLVAGDAAQFCNGLHREGSNFALVSGKLAAETVIEAKAKGDFSARSLSSYGRRVNDSFIAKDLRKYCHASHYMERHPALLTVYPDMVNAAAREFLTVDSVPKREKQWKIFREIRGRRSLFTMARELLGLLRVVK